MSVLLQISDPHFGTERPPVVEALVQLAHTLAPDLLILSGDITQRARRAQFAAARRCVDRLGVRTRLIVPGNHDIPLFNLAARVLDPYGGFRTAFGHDLEPVVDARDVLAVGVNTTRARRHVQGEVSAAQVDRVAHRLRGARADQLRVVVTHQPVCVVREKDEVDRLRGAEPAIRAWAAAGADLVLGGHIHLPYVAALDERHPGLPRKLWGVQAGTAVSHRVRWEADNSVNVIRYDARAAARCVVERWDFALQPARFEQVGSNELALDR
ncbi:MAG TPA: metallophosphoesterase [Nevskiaceae bacterium]|nr:metallophosphoesterase [Nevskiaceae bacterium]